MVGQTKCVMRSALFAALVLILAGCGVAPGPALIDVASTRVATPAAVEGPAADADTGAPRPSSTKGNETTKPAGPTREPVRVDTAQVEDATAVAAAPAAGANEPPDKQNPASESKDEVQRPAGWNEASHDNSAEPNYDVVFPEDKVNKIKIILSAEDYVAMQANMTELMGQPGASNRGARGEPGGNVQPPGAGGAPRGAGGRNLDFTPVNPSWFPATIEFNGETWTNVGVRYKGNSSLSNAWRSSSQKLPLKLDFDQFEDENPEIQNQRFYGFKQLSLGNAFRDATYMREILAYDLFRAAGLVAPQTALYEVILDYGDGPVNLGLYTAVEVVDDTVIPAAFGDDSSNIYEGDGAAASLAKGVDGGIETSFQKENNETEADWSDIQALYDVLHADTRTTTPEAWRAELEAVFDVDAFLKTVALNAVIQDWDQYGAMSHNYYLYHDPATGKLIWISWDHNEAFTGGRGGGGGEGGRRTTTLDQANVTESWPLIRFLLDDAVYSAAHRQHLTEAIALFDADALAEQIDALAELVRPYAAKIDAASFDSAVDQLKARIATQETALQNFLAQ